MSKNLSNKKPAEEAGFVFNPSVPTVSGHLPFVRAGQALSPPYEGGVAEGRGG